MKTRIQTTTLIIITLMSSLEALTRKILSIKPASKLNKITYKQTKRLRIYTEKSEPKQEGVPSPNKRCGFATGYR